MRVQDAKFSCHNSWKCTMNELNGFHDVRNPFIKGDVYSSSEVQDWCEEYEDDEWIKIEDEAFDTDNCFMFFVSDDGYGDFGGVWFEGVN